MSSRLRSSLTIAITLAVAPAVARAQATSRVSGERLTAAAAFGGLSGAANLNDAGTADWRLGWAASVNATYWVHPLIVLRYPVAAGTGTFIPYLLGGAGAISVHQLDSDSTWTKFAGNFGAGLEYRFGRVGVRAEGRDFVYKFDRNGFDKTQHDVAWQGGVTVSF